MERERFIVYELIFERYWMTPCCQEKRVWTTDSHRRSFTGSFCPVCQTEYSTSVIDELTIKTTTKNKQLWDWDDLDVFFNNEFLFKRRRNKNLTNQDKEEIYQDFVLSFLSEYREKSYSSLKSLKNCFSRVYQKYIYNKNKNNRLTTGQDFDRIEYSKLDHLSSLHLYIEELTSKSEKVNWEKVGKNFWRKIKSIERVKDVIDLLIPEVKFGPIDEPRKKEMFVDRKMMRMKTPCPVCGDELCYTVVEQQNTGCKPFLFGTCWNKDYQEQNKSVPRKGSLNIFTRLLKCEPYETKRLILQRFQWELSQCL